MNCFNEAAAVKLRKAVRLCPTYGRAVRFNEAAAVKLRKERHFKQIGEANG